MVLNKTESHRDAYIQKTTHNRGDNANNGGGKIGDKLFKKWCKDKIRSLSNTHVHTHFQNGLMTHPKIKTFKLLKENTRDIYNIWLEKLLLNKTKEAQAINFQKITLITLVTTFSITIEKLTARDKVQIYKKISHSISYKELPS